VSVLCALKCNQTSSELVCLSIANENRKTENIGAPKETLFMCDEKGIGKG
jgi:hypothetical protein